MGLGVTQSCFVGQGAIQYYVVGPCECIVYVLLYGVFWGNSLTFGLQMLTLVFFQVLQMIRARDRLDRIHHPLDLYIDRLFCYLHFHGFVLETMFFYLMVLLKCLLKMKTCVMVFGMLHLSGSINMMTPSKNGRNTYL